MKQKPLFLRLLALLLAALMLTGCSQTAMMDKLASLSAYMPAVPRNRTISKDSQWIDSSIDGAIDADTPTSVKTDFYTAVNRDFLLEPLPENTTTVSFLSDIGDAFADKVQALYTLSPEDTEGTDPEILPTEKLVHIQQLVNYMFSQGADAEGRAADGVEPLRPYLEKIEGISTMEELTAYFCNDSGQNLFGIQLAPFIVTAPYTDRTGGNYTVMVMPQALLTLPNVTDYREGPNSDGFGYDLYNRELLDSVLGRLGYTASQINALLAGCYRFECKLARCLPETSDVQAEDYFTENDTAFNREELDALCDSFPLSTILDAYGLGASETFTVPCTVQLSELGRIYRSKNLSDIKAYLEVQTVLSAVSLLDDDTNDLAVESKRQALRNAPTAAQEMTEEEQQNAALQSIFERFVSPYLADAFQQMYVAHYCTAQQKADLTDMTLKIRDAFRQTLSSADWLSDETRAEALAKLDNMGLYVLYPDNMTDYSSLSFDGCENLLDAIARINRFDMDSQTSLVNQKVDRSNWDLTEIPTTMVNAMYMPTNNSINILAGFLADGAVFSTEKPMEENLACIGTVIGHEITHGFDTNGYAYDQNGYRRMWWTDADRLSFDTRAADLIRFYSGLTPVADNSYLNGKNLSGEAIADMGGVKSALTVASGISGFDYDLFFRSYAVLWRTHDTYMAELVAANDEHPLAVLRTNVTLSQFDEFQKTYDIQPGDGMYVAPEDRILVW